MPILQINTTGWNDYQTANGTLKLLCLGEPGVGKTRSAGFWPKPIFADCEKGRMSVADLKVPYVEVTKPQHLFSLFDELARECLRPIPQRRFQTLVIDTIDAFQRILIQDRLDSERKEAFTGWQDWGYLDAKMIQLIQRMHQLDMNIVVNGHVKSANNDDGPPILGPKLKGDFREQIAAEFDLVGHMTQEWAAEDGKRVLKRVMRWQAHPGFPMLKDRSGRLPEKTPITFSHDDYTSLLARIAEGMDGLDEMEEIGQIELPESATPVPANIKGGPVLQPVEEPAPKTAAKRAKKADKPAPVPEPEPEPEVSISLVVPESGADVAPEDETDQTGLDAVATPVTTMEDNDEAIALAREALGAEVISEEPTADPTPAPVPPVPSASRVCGTAGRLKNGTMNPDPAPGCGRSLSELRGDDRNQVNAALMKVRTYLCPDCFSKVNG